VSWLLIVLVVFIALSPLITMMPTRRQKQIANLRQAAAVRGLSVQLREPPSRVSLEGAPVFYGRHRAREARAVPQSAMFQRDDMAWKALDGELPGLDLEILQEMPEGVNLVWLSPQEVGVFWDERGDEDDLATIDGVLLAFLAYNPSS
jgi:hypothetical protein